MVSILTGHGLKDSARAIEIATSKPQLVADNKQAIFEVLKPYLG